MEIYDGNTLPEPTALLEPEEQEVFSAPIAIGVDELACESVIDELLVRRERAQARIEQSGSDTLQGAGAALDLVMANRRLKVAEEVAGLVIVHQAEEELKRAA